MNVSPARISERQMQAIWYDAALRPRQLTTNRGSAITVISPGEWNLGAGPDFKNAVLEVGAAHRRVEGDVELHLCPADWDFHGHGADPNYRNVVAHVTWEPGRVPKSLPEQSLSIWLGRFVTSETLDALSRIDLRAYPYARLPSGVCLCESSIGHDPKTACRVLRMAGQHRLRMKARRLAGRIGAAAGNRSQVYYEEIMTALGYRKNAVQFRHVAERVPIADLPQENASARAALLVAGSFEDWDRSSCRPNNSPERRLESAADVFTTTATMDLADESDFSARTCRRMIKTMCGEHCMGKGRAAAVLANVIAPFALAEGRLQTVPEWLPPEDISMPIRLMAFRLFGSEHDASIYSGNGLLLQGLIQIQRDYCIKNHPECDECSLPEKHQP